MRRHLAAAWVLLLAGACTGASGGADEAPAGVPVVAAPAQPRAASPPVLRDEPLGFLEQQFAQSLVGRFPMLDVSRRTIALSELSSGGVGADDGIPSIQEPRFVTAMGASDWLGDREPVVVLEVNGDARIYPIQILIWHEIVSDTLGGVPVLATFCPLCNTAIAFEREVAGQVRRFGVSGLLRESDLVMYDFESHTLWQQATGEAIVGALAGERLRFVPAQIVSFADARLAFPAALVLSRETGFRRDYGENPYSGYDRIDSGFLAPTSFDDGRLPAKARVLTVEVGEDSIAIDFQTMWRRTVIQESVGGVPIVAFWQPGTVTALDSPKIAGARDVGAATAFRRELDGRIFEFEARDGLIYDTATGSRWNAAGLAVDGPLVGTRLEAVLSGNHFWFVWSVFRPETRVIVE
jgi:hypothetical protein